jgi:hypothetical protein
MIGKMNAKKILLSAILYFFTNALSAQIDIPGDSISNTLCRKWGFKAIIMGGQRLNNMNETVTYEFIANGTFKRISSDGKSENGAWTYKPEQKIISLKLKKTSLHIPSLTVDELIVSPGENMDETKKGLGIGTVLKPLGEN